MSTTQLLPQAFWFRFATRCARVEPLPKKSGDLPESCRLLEASRLDGKTPWAEVRTAWNPAGLAVEVTAEGDLHALGSNDTPDSLSYGLRVWVDTRDTRDVSRATRFCHRFETTLVKGKGKSALTVTAQQRPIARAVADAPICKPEEIVATAEKLPKGWRLSLWLPASVMHGFDPDTNRRLGFAYEVRAPDRDPQYFGVGRDFPIGENPSLWSTLELSDEGPDGTSIAAKGKPKTTKKTKSLSTTNAKRSRSKRSESTSPAQDSDDV
ncbi:MAG: hypothetical protein U0794_11310 [Isosphaeraceae bacterium]